MNKKNISLILLSTAAAFFISATNLFALTDLEKCGNENTALRVELERHQNIEDKLSAQIEELQNEKKQLNSEAADKDKQISALESQAKKAEEGKAAAEEKASKERQASEAKIKADAEKISSLQGQNKDLQAQNRELQQKNKELENQNNKAKQDSDKRERELLAQIDKLNKELAKEGDDKDQIEAKEGENEKLKKVQGEFDKRERELLAQIDKLKKELAECNEATGAYGNKGNASGKADKAKIASLEASVGELTAQLEECSSLLERCRDRVRQQQDRIKRLEAQRDEFRKELKKELESGDIRMREEELEKERIVININDSISFDSGSAELKDEVLPTLDKIANVLKNYPEHKVIVEGHSDSDRIVSSGFASNQDLSEARAQSVLDYLVIRSKLNEANFRVRGYGAEKPIAPNDTDENKALNRRVDIIVVPAGSANRN